MVILINGIDLKDYTEAIKDLDEVTFFITTTKKYKKRKRFHGYVREFDRSWIIHFNENHSKFCDLVFRDSNIDRVCGFYWPPYKTSNELLELLIKLYGDLDKRD